jgi:hypothetical protein
MTTISNGAIPKDLEANDLKLVRVRHESEIRPRIRKRQVKGYPDSNLYSYDMFSFVANKNPRDFDWYVGLTSQPLTWGDIGTDPD